MVETVFSVVKRVFGDVNQSRSERLRNKESKLRNVCYNIYRHCKRGMLIIVKGFYRADVKRTEDGVFMIASELFYYFEETQVYQFLSMLADNFLGGEIVFNSLSSCSAWIDMFPPEQRRIMTATLVVEALKDWWEKAPRDQKDKLSDVITPLEIPTKPKGEEWADVEAW